VDLTHATHRRVFHSSSSTAPIATYTSGPYCPSYGSSTWYCHDTEKELNVNALGLFTSMGQYAPHVSTSDTGGHSISQLWASQGSGSSLATVETGWIVDPGWWRDGYPHLFEFHTGDDYQDAQHDCYNACGFVGSSGSPIVVGERLPTNGSQAVFGTELYNSNWWLYYGGYWYGYIPQSDTSWNGNPLISVQTAEAGGEVSTGLGQCPSTQMGNGTWGHKSGSGTVNWAELLNTNGYSYLAPSYYYQEGTKLYDLGAEKPAQGGFQYGGPGC
jgi:hypothetical protein